jgi:CRISPR/Cas system-associated exonuclease Cas4 (RecB family)
MKQPLSRHLFHEYSRCKQRFWSLINQDIPATELDEQALFFKKQSSQLKDLSEKLLAQKEDCSYERNKSISIRDELIATADLYETHHKFGKTAIFEVRKSKTVKSHHIWDLAYLAYVFQKAGEPLRKMFIIHFNPEYTLEGDEIDVQKALKIVDVSRKVYQKLKKMEDKIQEILEFAKGPKPSADLAEHDCRSKDCLFIQKYHPQLPEFSVFDFKGINREQLTDLLKQDIIEIKDIPQSYVKSELQVAQMQLATSKETLIKKQALRNWLNQLQYPLYFLDYEALTAAVPLYKGTKAFQHIVFQYSLHRIKEQGAEVEHFEYLPKNREFPIPTLLAKLKTELAEDQGSIFVYHDSFEKSRNREMAVFCPEYTDWLSQINLRIVDLEKVFMLGTGLYQDPAFGGKTSLKKILPILLPNELHHSQLEISDGMGAAIQWLDYLNTQHMEAENIAKMREELLAYCKLDTLAMVQIFQFLENVVNQP